MPLPDGPFALTLKGIGHRYPAFESCNLDDTTKEYAIIFSFADLEDDPKFRRLCRRCFRVDERG